IIGGVIICLNAQAGLCVCFSFGRAWSAVASPAVRGCPAPWSWLLGRGCDAVFRLPTAAKPSGLLLGARKPGRFRGRHSVAAITCSNLRRWPTAGHSDRISLVLRSNQMIQAMRLEGDGTHGIKLIGGESSVCF